MEIVSELEKLGALVDWMPDRPFDSSMGKALTRFFPFLVTPAATSLYKRLLSRLGVSRYDYIFVINGQTLTPSFLQFMRQCFPAARFILYMWDSVTNRPTVKKCFRLYDSIFTFDSLDAIKYGLRFRALFYGSGFAPSDRPPSIKYHISFVGTAHSDRFSVVNNLNSCLPSNILCFWYLYLQAPWVFQAYRLSKWNMRHAKRSDFQFTPLAKDLLHSVFLHSKVVLDIAHPRQAGLTMRTFEALGSGKKLVTTNPLVRDYDFFSEANVFVIDRKRPFIDHTFLESSFSPFSQEILLRYSISGWLADIFDF
ncbi:hypothetical protein [Cyanobium sp. ATX-6F1]|uniref:hypothetical protein n=1 Tax=Cyanobium sp. ATX-6F1 TaxID=3137388 RepID=UPI0039BE5902